MEGPWKTEVLINKMSGRGRSRSPRKIRSRSPRRSRSPKSRSRKSPPPRKSDGDKRSRSRDRDRDRERDRDKDRERDRERERERERERDREKGRDKDKDRSWRSTNETSRDTAGKRDSDKSKEQPSQKKSALKDSIPPEAKAKIAELAALGRTEKQIQMHYSMQKFELSCEQILAEMKKAATNDGVIKGLPDEARARIKELVEQKLSEKQIASDAELNKLGLNCELVLAEVRRQKDEGIIVHVPTMDYGTDVARSVELNIKSIEKKVCMAQPTLDYP